MLVDYVNGSNQFSRNMHHGFFKPHNLPDTKVTTVSKEKYNELHIIIETTEQSTACRLCGKELKKRHGCDKQRKVRHLPAFGKPTYIIYKPNRYICEDCDNQPTTTATPSWHKHNSH